MIWFLASIIALAPFYLIRFNIGPMPTTVLEVLIVGFLFTRIWNLESGIWQKIKTLGKINWAIGLFVLAGIINTIISPEPIRALGLLRAFILEPVLMFYAIALTVNSKQITVIIRVLFWAVIAISVFGIFQYISFIHLPVKYWGYGDEPRRIVSLFAHPNALSLYLAPLFGLFSALWINNYPILKNRILSAFGIGIIGLAVLLTFSRGAWIAITVGAIFVLIKKFGLKKTALPIIVAGLIAIAIPQIQQRLALGISDPSSIAHFDLMNIGADKILSNPIFGNGLFGFRTTEMQANYPGEIHNYPHNIILSLWVELGLLGVLSFAWIINLTLKQYKNSPNILKFAASIFILVVLVHGLVDTPYFRNDLSLLFWFAISLFYID